MTEVQEQFQAHGGGLILTGQLSELSVQLESLSVEFPSIQIERQPLSPKLFQYSFAAVTSLPRLLEKLILQVALLQSQQCLTRPGDSEIAGVGCLKVQSRLEAGGSLGSLKAR
jgi:hypothetical protein